MNAKPTASFDGLGLPPVLVETMTSLGVTRPFPIQAATLPEETLPDRKSVV